MVSCDAIALDQLGDRESCINHSSGNPLILVIEDDPDNLVLLYHFLKLNQFDVLLASNALTGLALATAHSPDLILLDMIMPKMSGFDFIRRINKNVGLTHIPIVAVTGIVKEKNKQKVLQAGCAGYICKPYLLEHLLGVVLRQLDKLKPLAIN